MPAASRIGATFPAAAAALSNSTRRTYSEDWDVFGRWCGEAGIERFLATPAHILQYVESLTLNRRPLAPSTICRRVYSIAWHLKAAGYADPLDDPALRMLLQRNNRESSKRRVWQPLRVADLAKAFRKPPARRTEFRNRALILLMFAGRVASRHARALNAGDIAFVDGGYLVRIGKTQKMIHRGKTALCPVAAMEKWIEMGNLRNGVLFPVQHRWSSQLRSRSSIRLHDTAIREILRTYAKAIGLNPAGISCRSLLLGAELDFNATRALGL